MLDSKTIKEILKCRSNGKALPSYISDKYEPNLFDADVLELIENLEERIAIMSDGGWIPVDKKLPTKYAKYWVYTKSGRIFATEFRPDEEYNEEPFYQWGWVEPEAPEGWVSFYFDDGEHDIDEITHWMYCFEPPKGGF